MDAAETGAAIEKLDSVSFDALLAQQEPLAKKQAIFDLTGVQFVSPAALVQLAAACYAIARDGRQAVIRVPDPGVRSYLNRAGFFSVTEDVAAFDPPMTEARRFEFLRGSNLMLIEVTKIEKGSELPDLLDAIVVVLRERLKYRKYDAFDVATAVSEIAQNTFDHNTQTCGFVAMQVYGKGRRRFLEIGVADSGDGLAATLCRNPRHSPRTDLDAIKLAVQLGTSQHEDPTRGTGLHHLLEITYEHEGSVQLRSGAAKIRYRMDKKQGWSFSVPAMPGVQIALTLRSKEVGRKSS